MNYTEKVRQFTEACNDVVPAGPTPMSPDAVAFIRHMVDDEMAELSAAKTVPEQADALVDAIYYICDCAARHGMNLDPIFEIVHTANMSKVVDGKVLRRDDGKILKPEGWQDPWPNVEEEIARQEQEGAF